MGSTGSRTAQRHSALVAGGRLRLAETVGGAGLAAGTGALVDTCWIPTAAEPGVPRSGTRSPGARVERKTAWKCCRGPGQRSRGVVAAAPYRFAGREADDRIVHERARETLAQYVGHPHAVQVYVNDGVVTLTGDVLAAEDQRACRALKRVPGVKDVKARWTVHSDRSAWAARETVTARQRPRIAPRELDPYHPAGGRFWWGRDVRALRSSSGTHGLAATRRWRGSCGPCHDQQATEAANEYPSRTRRRRPRRHRRCSFAGRDLVADQ